MACKKEELREERRNRNASAAASVSVNDALLFTTICIIGMPVDVYGRDGSVYSGIFHTVSVDKDYAIVLKKATMIKKGNLHANVVTGTFIETLIVGSEDLVQVVSKGEVLPSDGIAGYVYGDDIEATAGYTESLNKDAEVFKPNELKEKKMYKTQLRQVRNGSQEFQSYCHNNPEFQEKRTIDETQVSSLSTTSYEAQSTGVLDILEDTILHEPKGAYSGSEDQDRVRLTSDDIVCSIATPPNVSVASISDFDVTSESSLSASSNSFLRVPPTSSSVERTAKESKLNPGAKIFSPYMLQHKMVTPPVLPIASMVTAQEETDASSFARSSVSVKFYPYNNATFRHGGNDAPNILPILRQVVNRTQPIRYTGQYQNYQTGSTYVHPSPQNVMFGRGGPLVRMHPISSDVQTVAGFSSATIRQHVTPHQMHLPKQQGNEFAQTLQLCMTHPVMANMNQPFVMSNSIPISQPILPLLRPISVPGSNDFLSSKFA